MLILEQHNLLLSTRPGRGAPFSGLARLFLGSPGRREAVSISIHQRSFSSLYSTDWSCFPVLNSVDGKHKPSASVPTFVPTLSLTPDTYKVTTGRGRKWIQLYSRYCSRPCRRGYQKATLTPFNKDGGEDVIPGIDPRTSPDLQDKPKGFSHAFRDSRKHGSALASETNRRRF